ncbi:MAG TPA: SpoIIE family protein phosphatase [Candidatus Cybelea sp.]|jgi:sigma-B regulation protein RsbU (phosphoserine phosphatase)|nr:SpoIIE family protein phosphatase [Candidatus Cybelea sp.]
MSSGPRLVVVDPNGTRRDVALSVFPFRIGRQAGNELTLRDSRVSRQQAQITDVNGTMVLEDMGSSHGTFVNGEKIIRHELKASDQIDFGVPDSYRVIYVGEGATIEELVGRIEAPAPSQAGPRELHHLGVLLDVARTLSSGVALEDILTTVVDAAIAVTRTERGVLLLTNPGGKLETAVARNAQRGTLRPEEMQISQGVLKRVSSSRRELIVGDTVADAAAAGRMNQGESIARLDLHTVVAIPIDKMAVIEAIDATVAARQSELLGILYLDSRAPSSTFSQLDREVVRTLAHEAATLIENARLFAAARVKARLDHEIEIASKIQQGLLPKALPNLPHVAMTGSTLACYSVGGDCFDVIELDGERHGFFVGDISGKGISAALLATLLQGIFFTTASMDLPLTGIFSRVNRYLCDRSGGDRYATVFYGVLDKAGTFEYVNAGHVPPLIRRGSGVIDRLDLASFPVGMFPEAEYESASVKLEKDDFLVIYTDGVSEAANVQAEMFEEERLRGLLENFKGQTVEQLAETIREGVKAFTEGAAQSDDVTILVIQYKGTA